MKNKAILFGPFVGEFLWELYYFVDLYGKYADVISPLKIPQESDMRRSHFSIEGLPGSTFNRIKQDYLDHFEEKYFFDEMITPEVSAWKKDIKWQFPRDETSYEFLPRNGNVELITSIFKHRKNMILNNTERVFLNYRNIRLNHIKEIVDKTEGSNFSFYGVLIEILKECYFYIGPFDCEVARLAMLLKIPVITEKVSVDPIDLNLINPVNNVVIEEEYFRGVKVYENNFRSEKDGVGE